MEKHICLIGLGSNTEKYANLAYGRRKLSQIFPCIVFGKEKETAPLYISNPAFFLNQLGSFFTSLPVEEVISLLKEIEKKTHVNPQDKKNGIVKLDIDLLVYDDKIIKPDDLSRNYILESIKELKPILLADFRYKNYAPLINKY